MTKDYLFKSLASETSCEVRQDAISRKIYSVDASIYEVEPFAVVIPKTREDLIKAISIAQHYGIAVTARGAATGITGGCLGEGIIIDTSKYLNHIQHIDWGKKSAQVEVGVIQDDLNHALSAGAYRLGPDTSTGDRATLGGMAANNAAGARSLLYGKMVDAVESIELILSGGEVLQFSHQTPEEWQKKLKLANREGHIYREIASIRETYREEIKKKFPQIPRRASGYNLDELIKPDFGNIAKLIVGSEGTLGVISSLRVRIDPLPKHVALCLIFFEEIGAAMHSIPYMLEFKPIALEMIDDKIVSAGINAPSLRGKLAWLNHFAKTIFVAEFQAEDTSQLKALIEHFQSKMVSKKIGLGTLPLYDLRQINEVWELRKAGLGLLLSKRSYSRAIAFIEDLSLPPEKLEPFFSRFFSYLNSVGKEAGIYGHVGSGCMHIRPFIDLRSADELLLAKKMMEDISKIVLELGGAMSGEHGDGLIRSWMNEKMFGPQLYAAFKKLKTAFDPDNLMNPGKIVDAHPFEKNLRFDPLKPLPSLKTFFSFKSEGGFELAVDLCNGNGRCRKKSGLMCPSFQVTGDEYDSTRARANALRGILQDELKPATLANEDLHAILELCIQCKGCKTECPSEVDMAKMKAETLYHYQEKNGYKFKNRLFAHLGSLLSLGSYTPLLFNFFRNSAWLKKILDIANERSLPKIAKQKFSSWFAKHSQAKGKPLVLYNDTYTEFLHPEVGIAAVKVFNALGYEVIVPPWTCCGRTQISKGFLENAKRKAQNVSKLLHPYLDSNIPVVGLEPSCLLTLKDEYSDLIGKELPVYLFDSFLAEYHLTDLSKLFHREERSILIHTHCHQKALVGTKASLEVLRSLTGWRANEIPSGCCGMAGSFGYEQKHFEMSMKMGELALFKNIRQNPECQILANGFSCRTQINDGTQKSAHHLAEFLAKKLR